MNWVEKYRPCVFTDMVGQGDILSRIEGFILSGDIPHLLFYGETPGVGKTTTALIVAHKLLGEHLDGNFIEINASDNRKIEDMRNIVVKAIKHLPFFSPLKIIFLDEADGLTSEAQALLRRPMEKSKHTLFILCCNDINSIIQPIQSRCAIFEFMPITSVDIIEGLRRIVEHEGQTLSDNMLGEIASRSGGDMRFAVNELQKEIAHNGRNTEIERIVQHYIKTNGVKA